ncbi:MAG: radical SAM family heme chaperone HemW [Planctomycetota bacterium]|jgi:oxygen-independent coproporphyrinogen-3 oxidase
MSIGSSVTQITSGGRRLQAKKEGAAAPPAGLDGPRAATAADLLPGLDASTVVAAYLHVPFCRHKCHYCDFYSLVEAAGRDRRAAFTDRLVREIEAAAAHVTGPLGSVFVGGGTPTLLSPACWRRLLEAVEAAGWRGPDTELTVEANPETVTDELAATLVAGGVNRMSLGAQSFEPALLRTLERHHDPASVGRAIRRLRTAGIGSINLDLIFAIPGQTPAGFARDLDRALDLPVEHLSCYGLMYEPGTPLTARLRTGRVTPVEETAEAAMYETARARLAGRGLEQYEISNWARPGHRCRHNLAYWRNEDWWPLGPSAAGHVAGVRWRNRPRLGDYLEADGPWPPIRDVERLDDDGRVGETFMLGLRLVEGLDLARAETLLARGERGPARRAALERHERDGLVERTDDRLRLTGRGQLLANTVVTDLL